LLTFYQISLENVFVTEIVFAYILKDFSKPSIF